MEDQELSLQKPLRKKNIGMALPLTLIFLLVGAVLVGTALYVVENMFSTSKHVVTETQLYNAAQSGIEQGKKVLWENRENLDLEEREYIEAEDLDSIRVRLKDVSNAYLDDDLQELSFDGLPGVKLIVDLLDCNYSVNETTYNLDPDEIAALPPRWPGGEGGEGGEGTGESEGPSEGTSMIIDPSRFFNIGGGGGGERRFVIRSSASETREGGQEVKIEVMVVLLQ